MPQRKLLLPDAAPLLLKIGRKSFPVQWDGPFESINDEGRDVFYVRMIRRPGASGHARADAIAGVNLALDVDIGKAGGYETKDEAVAALLGLCEAGHLPDPSLVIDSGTGLHVYWTPLEPLPVALTSAMSLRLLQVIAQRDPKLVVDRTSLKNCFGLLRPPETRNYKYSLPVPVRAVAEGEAFSVADLMRLIPPLVRSKQPLSKIERVEPLADGAWLLENCAALQYYYDNRDTATFEQWVAVMNLAPYVEDGLEWAHFMSEGKKYDAARVERHYKQKQEEALRRLDGEMLPGPTRCATLLRLYDLPADYCKCCREVSPVFAWLREIGKLHVKQS